MARKERSRMKKKRRVIPVKKNGGEEMHDYSGESWENRIKVASESLPQILRDANTFEIGRFLFEEEGLSSSGLRNMTMAELEVWCAPSDPSDVIAVVKYLERKGRG